MSAGPTPGQGFEVSLDELAACANDSLRGMVTALDQALAVWPSEPVPVINPPGTAGGRDLVLALQGLNGLLLDRQRRGRDATAVTQQALVDIHTAYQRADQQVGGSFGG
jgi:hypothetical protein